ncbi:MAG: GNAT family N-acetyltransferase [Acidimicrobiia bacterium]|nr:GNAT family N-acetyltransferase [Acidimicrobiia bacterium]
MDLDVVEAVDAGELEGLYRSVGWSAYAADPAALARAVENSTFVVAARIDGELIGLARGLSDDVSVFYLQDVLVRPEWQGKGVGRALLASCLERFRHVRQKVLLTDREDRQHRFYRAAGYREVSEIGDDGLQAFVQIEGLQGEILEMVVPTVCRSRVLSATGSGDVVLLHDTAGYSTYNALRTIIPVLEKRGYTFETICG